MNCYYYNQLIFKQPQQIILHLDLLSYVTNEIKRTLIKTDVVIQIINKVVSICTDYKSKNNKFQTPSQHKI
jgi:hypothetical protein